MKKPYFPVYTEISKKPIAICEKLPVEIFDYPFFNDAVPYLRPYNSIRKRMDLSIEKHILTNASLKIAGFIFHTSHCGSTLLANMLKASKKTRVVSEPEAINGLFISDIFYNREKEEILSALETIIAIFLQPLGPAEKVIFKLTSWNIFFIELFQKLFPDVPWLYIDRNKDAVVKSLLSSGRGFLEWWHHPTDLLRNYFLEKSQKPENLEQYLQTMVHNHKTEAQKANADNLLLLEYPDFIDVFETSILPHFHLSYSENELTLAREATKIDAKSFAKAPFEKKTGFENLARNITNL